MDKQYRYNIYSEYLKNKYGQKVYKIPINIPVTCPNRDGLIGYEGCIFCGEVGTGYESLPNKMEVPEQITQNMKYITQKYKAKKFIAYFQNFTNTYLPLDKFKEYILDSCISQVVEISISTRPDCICDEHLDFLYKVKEQRGINITFEIGLQTVNYHTLYKINRGHTLAEFIDAVLRVKKYGFEVCTHVILDFPWDDMYDVVENAKILSSLNINQVKIHSLYIVKNTKLEKMYNDDKVKLFTKEDYIDRVVTFLEYLNPKIVIQRVIGRAPKEDTIMVNWNTSWWKVKDEIDQTLIKKDTFQGKKFNYLNGNILENMI